MTKELTQKDFQIILQYITFDFGCGRASFVGAGALVLLTEASLLSEATLHVSHAVSDPTLVRRARLGGLHASFPMLLTAT